MRIVYRNLATPTLDPTVGNPRLNTVRSMARIPKPLVRADRAHLKGYNQDVDPVKLPQHRPVNGTHPHVAQEIRIGAEELLRGLTVSARAAVVA